jgi:hypothetical protein
MTEYELRRAAAAAEQREQDRREQHLRDHQRRRDEQRQALRRERITALRTALHTTFGADIEQALGGRFTVVGDEVLMDVVYEVPVGDVVLRLRQVRDEEAELWVCEAVAGGTRVPVKTVPDRVAVNRDRLLLALHTVYGSTARSAGGRERADA